MLSLALFGPLSISRDGRPISGLAYNKARALLAYLAVESDRAHHRDALVAMLWPNLDGAAARANLRPVLANLREALGDSGDRPILHITRDTLQLDPEGAIEIDVAQFTALIQQCEQHRHRAITRCPACIQRMEQAIALYRGDFLAQFSLPECEQFEEWALLHREHLQQQALDLLTHLTHYYEHAGAYATARGYAQRQLALEPWRETAHRAVMRLFALEGQRTAALKQYQRCVKILEREFAGAQPERATTELANRIRQGRFPAHLAGAQRARSAARLPVLLTPLIGRTDDLNALGEWLGDLTCHIITIVGPGGIGKTRLALAAAHKYSGLFRDGAVVVALGAVDTPSALVSHLAAALQLTVPPQDDPLDHIQRHLSDKDMLLILDNFEQLVGYASVVRRILLHAPAATALVTSRERLHLPDEWVYELEGLSLHSADDDAQATESPAVQLFVTRARQASPRFTLDPHTRGQVERICRLVGGMPLALELAAAAVATHSCAEIAAEIERGIAFLASSSADPALQQRSIQAVFDRSWQHLSAEAQAVFCALAVFVGSFSYEAAAQVAGATRDLMHDLVQKSLVRRIDDDSYHLHELIRQYAAERLRQSGQQTAAQARHFQFFLQIAAHERPHEERPNERAWLDQIAACADDLRAALGWAQTHDAPGLLTLASMLGPFWNARGGFRDGRQWLEHALAANPSPSPMRAYALLWAAELAGQQSDYRVATEAVNASMALFRQLNDLPGYGRALQCAAGIASQQSRDTEALTLYEAAIAVFQQLRDDHSVAHTLVQLALSARAQGVANATITAYLQQSLALFERTGDTAGVAHALAQLGEDAFVHGDYAQSAEHYERSLRLFQRLGDRRNAAWAHCGVGEARWYLRDRVSAQRHYEQSYQLFTDLDTRLGIGMVAHHLGQVARDNADDARAEALLLQSLSIMQSLNREEMVGRCLADLAGVALVRQQPAHAVRLLAAATTIFAALPPFLAPAHREEYDAFLQAARASMGADAFAALWSQGQQMGIDELIARFCAGDMDEEALP